MMAMEDWFMNKWSKRLSLYQKLTLVIFLAHPELEYHEFSLSSLNPVHITQGDSEVINF